MSLYIYIYIYIYICIYIYMFMCFFFSSSSAHTHTHPGLYIIFVCVEAGGCKKDSSNTFQSCPSNYAYVINICLCGSAWCNI